MVNLSSNHWTVRWYREYVRLGGFGRDPENLCRFLRVITVWAPLRWLLIPHGKDQLPMIVYIIGSIGLSFILLFTFGALAVQTRDAYVQHGMAGFVPSHGDVVVTGYILGSIAALIVTIVVWSGLYRLYKERYKYAKAGGLCPFIEIENGVALLPQQPQGAIAEPTVDEDGQDPLLDAAIETERWLTQQYADSAVIPSCLPALRSAIAGETEEEDADE